MLQFFMVYLYIHPVRFNIFWNFGKMDYFKLLSILYGKSLNKTASCEHVKTQSMLLHKQGKILSVIVNIEMYFGALSMTGIFVTSVLTFKTYWICFEPKYIYNIDVYQRKFQSNNREQWLYKCW